MRVVGSIHVPLAKGACGVACCHHNRLDTSIALQVEKFHADAEERRKEKEAARMQREAAHVARYVQPRTALHCITPQWNFTDVNAPMLLSWPRPSGL